MAIEFIETGDVLLYVGDAQAGNWRSWDEYTWHVPDKNGTRQTVNAASLLSRTIFYKVGHHGSHNATLREKGLERMMSPRLISFIPVDEDVAHNVKNWKHMPLPDLCSRLKEKSALVLSTDTKQQHGKPPTGTKLDTAPDDLYYDLWL